MNLSLLIPLAFSLIILATNLFAAWVVKINNDKGMLSTRIMDDKLKVQEEKSALQGVTIQKLEKELDHRFTTLSVEAKQDEKNLDRIELELRTQTGRITQQESTIKRIEAQFDKINDKLDQLLLRSKE